MSVLGETGSMAGDALRAESPPGSPPALVALRSPGGTALIAATVLASMVGFLDANVINVAVPAIGRDLHAHVSAVQWILSSYLVAVAALLLLSGALADRFGRRRLLAVGLMVMLGGSVLCSAAPSVGALIGARVIQGLGASMVVPSSLALLNGTLRVSDRARGIGVWAGLAWGADGSLPLVLAGAVALVVAVGLLAAPLLLRRVPGSLAR